MARQVVGLTLATAIAVCLSGCGTMRNVWCCCSGGGEFKVYGGVRSDFKSAWDGTTSVAKCDSVGEAGEVLALSALLLAVDVPLSLVGDTLTLPFTVPSSLGRLLERKPDNPPSPAAPTQEASPAPQSQEEGSQ